MPKRQQQVLTFIENRNRPPTIREIQQHLGVSSLATVHKHLRALQRKKLVDWTPHAQRSLRSNRVPAGAADTVGFEGGRSDARKD